MAYSEFPLVMVHPNHVPAKVERPSPGKPLQPGESPQKPEAAKFPPVTVNNEDQAEYYRAQGYTGGGDPAAHEPPLPPGYEAQEYPKWVGDQIVNSAQEEAALKPKKK